ncbi:hypothetical protein D3C78_1843670 [compost metagenome]
MRGIYDPADDAVALLSHPTLNFCRPPGAGGIPGQTVKEFCAPGAGEESLFQAFQPARYCHLAADGQGADDGAV